MAERRVEAIEREFSPWSEKRVKMRSVFSARSMCFPVWRKFQPSSCKIVEFMRPDKSIHKSMTFR